jgi:hypothetical protein
MGGPRRARLRAFAARIGAKRNPVKTGIENKAGVRRYEGNGLERRGREKNCVNVGWSGCSADDRAAIHPEQYSCGKHDTASPEKTIIRAPPIEVSQRSFLRAYWLS